MNPDLQELRDTIVNGLNELKRETEVGLTKVHGCMERLEQKVDLRHESAEKVETRVLDAERDIDTLQQKQAATSVKIGVIGAISGGLAALAKSLFGE